MAGAGGYAAARSVADQLSSLPPPHSSSDMNRAEKAALWRLTLTLTLTLTVPLPLLYPYP